MRTVFTGNDLKQYIEYLFNGNFATYKTSNGSTPYENPNSEQICLIDTNDGSKTDFDLAQYLNIQFYTWKDRLIEKSTQGIDDSNPLHYFEDWVASLNFSMHESYALVEKTDEEIVASQDIDSATITGRITFLVQADKVSNLDYYIGKIRNKYLGMPQDIQNSYGDIIKAFLVLGIPIYEQEPSMTQVGECVIVSCNFRLSYLADARTYSDERIELSLDNQENYYDLPLTRGSFQRVFNATPLPKYERPDLTGYINSSVASLETLSFYDYNKPLTNAFNELFWQYGAISIDGTPTTTLTPNIPVYIRITSGNKVYVYKEVITQMEKVLVNNDFNICSISLKGYGKV